MRTPLISYAQAVVCAAGFTLALGVSAGQSQTEMTALKDAEALYQQLWSEAPLTFDVALFTEGPATGYGAYIARRDNTFDAGETLFIYAQPSSFGFGKSGRLHTIDLLFDIAILDSTDEMIFQQDAFGSFAFQSYEQNREIMFNADITADLPPGDYVLQLRVRDQHKDGQDVVDLPFKIAAP